MYHKRDRQTDNNSEKYAHNMHPMAYYAQIGSFQHSFYLHILQLRKCAYYAKKTILCAYFATKQQ